MEVLTITSSTNGVDCFCGRRSSSSNTLSCTVSTSYNKRIGYYSNYYYATSFFFNVGDNAELWEKAASLPTENIKSIKLTFNLSTIGSYTTNEFTYGQKAANNYTSTAISSSLGKLTRSSSSSKILTANITKSGLSPTAAWSIGQTNAVAAANYTCSNAVLVIEYEEPETGGKMHVNHNGVLHDGTVYYNHNGVLLPGSAYLWHNGELMGVK